MTVAIILISIIVYYLVGRITQSVILIALNVYIYWVVAPEYFWVMMLLGLLMALYSQVIQKHQNKWILSQLIVILCLVFISIRLTNGGVGSILGFSVLAFSSISLLVDQYRTGQKFGYLDSLNYILFAPKIFAGPIVRASNFVCSTKKTFCGINVYIGFKYLIFAAFCKFALGELLTKTDCDGQGINLFFQIMTFALNFFFDFWAYSLMAMGAGLVLGYNLPKSFHKPYYSLSFREFWHRWNITLGTWLRDYIYIPLGGNRNSGCKWGLSIMAVFLISGLWHGSTWPFIVWGVCHGLLIIIERGIIKPEGFTKTGRAVYGAVIFILVAFLWQLFIVDKFPSLFVKWQDLFTASPVSWRGIMRFIGAFGCMCIFTDDGILRLIERQSEDRKTIIREVTLLSAMILTLIIFNQPVSFNFFYFRF